MSTNKPLTPADRIKRSLATIRKVADDIQDYEAADALLRCVRDLESDLFEMELAKLPATDDLAVAWDARPDYEVTA